MVDTGHRWVGFQRSKVVIVVDESHLDFTATHGLDDGRVFWIVGCMVDRQSFEPCKRRFITEFAAHCGNEVLE